MDNKGGPMGDCCRLAVAKDLERLAISMPDDLAVDDGSDIVIMIEETTQSVTCLLCCG